MKFTVESKYDIGDTVRVPSGLFGTFTGFDLVKAVVVKAEAKCNIWYLVESSDGERKWIDEGDVKAKVDDEQH